MRLQTIKSRQSAPGTQPGPCLFGVSDPLAGGPRCLAGMSRRRLGWLVRSVLTFDPSYCEPSGIKEHPPVADLTWQTSGVEGEKTFLSTLLIWGFAH